MIAARVWRAGLALALILAVAFAVAAPPERCPSVSAGELRRSAQASVDWFVRNQNTDGTWLYLYDADDDSTPSEYNPVRHAGVDDGPLPGRGGGLAGRAALRRPRHRVGARQAARARRLGRARPPTRVATGATALLAAGLVIRREATGDTRYDDVLRRLGRFLLAQTEPSGAVLASYDPARGAPVAGEYSKYFTGEAYWALARLHRTFPGEGWGEAADRIGAYLATSRDDVEDHWPPIPDHWAATAWPRPWRSPSAAARRSPRPRWTTRAGRPSCSACRSAGSASASGPGAALVRGSYVPRGGGYGVISEALTGWWLTARAEPRLADLRAPDRRARHLHRRAGREGAVRRRGRRQRCPAGRVEGAWFLDGETRMDDQQHALAGLLRTIPIAEAAERARSSSDADDDAPSGWLWAAALLLALNPARAAFGIPRAGRSRARPSPAWPPLGGAIGGLLVCAAAAVGDPLLDALDVSDPSFRLAAGIVAAVAGAADLFRRPPAPEPALPGWRAALVPVAIPVVARPALLVLALGAGADHGVLLERRRDGDRASRC